MQTIRNITEQESHIKLCHKTFEKPAHFNKILWMDGTKINLDQKDLMLDNTMYIWWYSPATL